MESWMPFVQLRKCTRNGVVLVALGIMISLTGTGMAQEEKQHSEQTAATGEEATLFPVPNYAGDLWSRSFLTGDWGGIRKDLAQRGVQLELDMVQIFQGVADGGRNTTAKWGGSSEAVLKLDFDKLGLWPGAFLFARAEAAFQNTVNSDARTIMPVNTEPIWTLPSRDEVVLSHVIFTQFLSEKFGVFLGKLDTTGGDTNEFAHGKGDKKFMNLAFSINPVAVLIVPYSTLGAGFVYLPHKDVIFSFSAIDGEGVPNRGGFDTIFENSTTLGSELRVTVRPFGLTGHQLLGFGWGNGNFVSLKQDPRTILRTIILGTPLKKESGSWAFMYNFDQYLYTEEGDPSQGFGLFGRVGVADEKSSPFHQFYSFGFGGKGLFPSRDNDQFGIGYYYMKFSNDLPRILRRTLGLDHEQGGELFYNIEALPWLHITPDLQIIGSGDKNLDTVVVAGFRVKIDF